MNEPWCPVAQAHHYALTVYTISAAMASGFAVSPSTAVVGLCVPDEGDPVPINFLSVESLREFVLTCAPRSMQFRAAPGESLELVRAVLLDERRTLH